MGNSLSLFSPPSLEVNALEIDEAESEIGMGRVGSFLLSSLFHSPTRHGKIFFFPFLLSPLSFKIFNRSRATQLIEKRDGIPPFPLLPPSSLIPALRGINRESTASLLFFPFPLAGTGEAKRKEIFFSQNYLTIRRRRGGRTFPVPTAEIGVKEGPIVGRHNRNLFSPLFLPCPQAPLLRRKDRHSPFFSQGGKKKS